MSQVKNLRAMFENKGDAPNPPERGRTLTPSNNAEASKPLSKVRTNFIAIEKDGRVGLQRDHSGESSVSRRRLSIETTEGAETVATSVAERTESIATVDDPIKVIPISASVSEPAAISTQPPPRPGPPNEPVVSVLSASPRKATTGLKREGTPDAAANANGRQADPPNSHRKESRDAPARRNLEAKVGSRPATLAVSPAMKPPARAGSKSPSIARPLLSPSAREGRAAKPPPSPGAPAQKKTVVSLTPIKQTSNISSQKPTPSSSARRPPPPIHVSPSNNITSGVGFVKPKPKSPTKPVKLPASLMAPTAASGSKINPSRLPTGSGDTSQVTQPAPRSTSRASTATTTSVLKRQSSAGGSRPRPSVGPPPTKLQHDKSAAKKEKQVDEGFLARMMRPTQSSQSKTTDKLPITPPKKAPTKRASTRQGERSESRSRRASSTRRLPSRSVSPSRTGTPSSASKAPLQEEPITEDMVRAAKEAASTAVAIAPVTCEGPDPTIIADAHANLGPTRELLSSSELPPVETDSAEQAPLDEGSNAVSSLDHEDTAVSEGAGPVLDEPIGVGEPVAIDESVSIDEPDNTVPIQPEPIILFEEATPIVAGAVNSVLTPTTDAEQSS